MNIAELHKRDPEKNMARSYRILVTPTLFGSWAVVREWAGSARPARCASSGLRAKPLP